MKKLLFLLAISASPFLTQAQEEAKADTSWKHIYRGTDPKINDLVHTKLDVKFDYDKAWMYGKAWITLKPHFYPTDSLSLDAKGMTIKEISIVKGASKKPLKYTYDETTLKIQLDKSYNGNEPYTIYIDYISKPNEVKVQGSAAITDAKGLYFINPKGEIKDKPIQIWTQGETEANSVWFPTIDKPYQKTTEEIYMTVPAKYVTLSNGKMVSQKKNTDGTRTDFWKMDLPHSPYLFFMGVGDFAIVKDHYKEKEVNYYVEKKYESVAKKIFGETPNMIGFYERTLGVPYQWPKYSQIVGRDYVSGAMENTSATLHQESAYQNARQLTDGNHWEETIAHELFHQWFGDLVTAESWSNITLNESFADYSEYLWDEYRHGKDAADEHNFVDMQEYIFSGSENKDLVRFHYADKEEVFDRVSYSKGGRILNMLRNYVGDKAFFASLNKYLTDNKFKSAEAQNLRLAFEEVTGLDMNWFWNQWYYGSGHPKLNISYTYENGKSTVYVEQTHKTGKVFKLPVAIDVYNGANKVRYKVWVQNQKDTFSFNTPVKPDLVNFDGDKVLLAEKTDNKTTENYIHQWKFAPNYLDRREALDYFAKKNMPELANGLKDRFEGLRLYTLTKLDQVKDPLNADVLSQVQVLAQKDPSKLVKAKAIDILGKLKDSKYLALFNSNVGDSSYSVSGASLEAITKLDPDNAYSTAKKYSNDAKGRLGRVTTDIIIAKGDESDFEFVSANYQESAGQAKLQMTKAYAAYLEKVKDPAKVKKGVGQIMDFRNEVPEQFRGFVDPTIKDALNKLGKVKKDEGNIELSNHINGLMK